MPAFKPNLACEPVGAITFPKLASPKLDGIRCIIINGQPLTRSLKPIPNLHIRKVLSQYDNLDGEIVVGSPTDEAVYTKTFSAVSSFEGEPVFTFQVFDRPLTSGPYVDRLSLLLQHPEDDIVKILAQTNVHNQEQLDDFYQYLLDSGYEGAIIRNPHAHYKHGRSTPKSQDMLKLKPYADGEAVVLAVYEALYNGNEAFLNELGYLERSTHQANLEGKGMIGGFHVRDLATGIEFDCAPGKSTHEQRIEWWLNKPVGNILKYRYMPYGAMANSKPRFPRFIGWRMQEDMS